MWLRIDRVPKLTNFPKRQLQLFLSLLLGVVFMGWLLPASAQQTIAFDDYRRLIGQANSQARSAIGQSPAQCRAILGEIAGELTAVAHVQLPDGTIMPVTHAGANQILQATPCNPQKAINYLAGICPIHICLVTSQPADESSPADDFGQPIPPSTSSGQTSGANGEPSNTTTGDNGQTSAPEAGTQADGGESQPGTTGVDTAVSPNSNPTNPDAATDNGENTTGESNGSATGEGLPDDAQNGDADTAVSNQPGSDPQGEGEPTNNPTDSSVTLTEGEGMTGEASQTTEEASDAAGGEEETAVSDPESPPDETIDIEETPNNQTQIMFIALIILIIFALTLLIVYLWYRQREEEAKRRKRQGKPASAAAAVAEGRRQIEDENYREAVRQLFLATLLALEERGILQFDKTLTNYELLTKMRGNPSIMTTLHSVVGTVERVWYGFEPLASHDYEALVTEIDALRVAPE